ncbi:unnamed protein product [[Candida] boidinii]|uniref:Unnamed protein product n=1 Tax=Candida boidinii TaxID=5477 RepID=A0ACB5TYR9_CANBO|nr:unnamed protein product [[Candida] boidinii]
MSRDQTIKELTILEYYIDGIKPLINMIFCTKIKRVDFATFFKETKIYDGDALTEKRFKEFTASELSSSYDQYMKERRPNSYESEEDVFLTAQSNNSNRGNFNGTPRVLLNLMVMVIQEDMTQKVIKTKPIKRRLSVKSVVKGDTLLKNVTAMNNNTSSKAS